MSRDGSITLDWGGEPERAFRLGIGEIKKLQETVDAGPTGIAAKCQITLAVLGAQKARDWIGLSQFNLSQIAEKPMVREALKQGLLGAGVPLPSADKLLREYVDERPLAENLITAIEVCMAAVFGVEDEDAAGESEAVAEEVSTRSPTASSGSGKTASTPSAPPAGSPLGTSTR